MHSTQVSRRALNPRVPDCMGRWTQYEEDAERLPEGFKRIAYDSETRRYTFQDRKGALYESEPGNEFGVLTPVTNATMEARILKARPNAFEPSDPAKRRASMPARSSLSSFGDFLPSEAITSPSNASSSSKRASSGNSSEGMFRRFKNVKSAVSKMQDSVSQPRRTHTHSTSYSHPSSYKTPASAPVVLPSRKYRAYTDVGEEDTRALLRQMSISSAASTSTTSTIRPVANPDSTHRPRSQVYLPRPSATV